MKKHVFTHGWPEGYCLYCNKKAGVDDWQLQQMPKEMAACEKGKKAVIIEILKGSFNCRL